MTISNYLEPKILDAVFNNVSLAVATPYVSLHQADPGETGASEVSGGSYARQLGSFGAAVVGAIANDAPISFTGMPDTTANDISHVGVWDAATVGNFLWGGPLTTPKVTNSGDTFTIATGDLDVTLD